MMALSLRQQDAQRKPAKKYLFVDMTVENGPGDRPAVNATSRRALRTVVMKDFMHKERRTPVSVCQNSRKFQTGGAKRRRTTEDWVTACTNGTGKNHSPGAISDDSLSDDQTSDFNSLVDDQGDDAQLTVALRGSGGRMDFTNILQYTKTIYRTNIVARTCEDHYPKIMPRWRCDLGSSVPWDIDYKAVFSHPVPSSESLVLLSFGCSNNDQSIIMEGNRRYLAAVESIRRDISSIAVPADLNRKVCFIAMKILTLSLCEQFKTISPDGAGWIKHVNGVNAIFKATNRPVPPDQRFIVWTARHVCLVMSLSRRQAMDERLFFRLLHEPGEYEKPRSGSTEQLYQLCVPLPRMLQLTDIICHSQHTNPMTVMKLHARLLSLERALITWSQDFVALQTQLHTLCRNHCHVQDGRFEHEGVEFVFQNFARTLPTDGICMTLYMSAQALAFHSICVLLVWQAILDLEVVAGQDLGSPGRPALQFRIDALVEHLIDALVLFANVMQPFTRLQQMSGILHFLTQHLERSGSEELLQRCRDWGFALRRDNDHVIWDARVPWSFFPMSALLSIEMQAAFDEP